MKNFASKFNEIHSFLDFTLFVIFFSPAWLSHTWALGFVYYPAT